MKTVYIKGIKNFKKKIRKGLLKSLLIESYDYIEGLGNDDYCLIWLRQDLLLRDFKLAISAKYVWKNRLKFYENIEDLNPKIVEDEFSYDELDWIKRAREKMEV
jgi:hypothetical protein